MLETFQQLFAGLGLSEPLAAQLSRASAVVLVILLSAVAFFVAKLVLMRAIHAVARRTDTHWDDKLVENRVFFWLAHLAPAIVRCLPVTTSPRKS